MNKNNNIFIKCLCYTHLLEIEKNEDNTFSFVFWNYGERGRPLNWRGRLRWIWRIIRTGNPWTDMIEVGREDAERIIKFLKND